MPRTKKVCLAAIAALASAVGLANAETIYGVTDAGALVRFDSATPGALTNIGTVTGLLTGHTTRGIDFRPFNGELYLISTDSTGGTAQLYTVNLSNAALTPMGASFALTGNTSTRVSMDFNPAADRLRIVTADTVENNFRWNPVTNAFVQADASLLYDAGDPNSSTNPPFVAGVAYDRNDNDPTTGTTLYAYDFDLDDFSTIGSPNGTPVSPNAGTMFTIGNAGIVTTSASFGFDISISGVAYVNANVATNDNLYTVNLSTGQLTLVGSLGTTMLDISAVVPEPASLGLVGLSLAGLVRRPRRA